jgi:polysaccharide chain length determinant protein (PEP-CTERM system associated)
MQFLLDRLLDEIRGAWRFRWIAVAVAWGVALLSWAVVFFMRDTYEVTARVYVDPQTMLSEATRGLTIESDVDTHIQRVRQALLSGSELDQVAQSAGLMAEARSAAQRQAVVEGLRRQIQIAGDLQRGRAGTIILNHRNSDREAGLQVVQLLLDNFIDGTIGGKRQSQEQTQAFLEAQIADVEQQLTEAENRLAAFKKANVGLMPGAQGDYYARLQREMESVRTVQASLDMAIRRRDELDRQLREQDPVTVAASPSAGGAAAVGSETAKRIQETRARLDELLLRYTDRHPDVVSLRETLQDLEVRQQSEINAVRRGEPGAAAQAGLTANPVYQSLQLQFNQAEVDIATIRAQIADHQRTVANLRSMVNTVPEVEAELARLDRDYDVKRAQHQALVSRLEAAKLGEQAEATGSVQVAVIDPPTASFQPVTPNRQLLVVFSLLLALGAGGSVAFVLHLFKPVFGSARQLADITGLPVLGQVSMTWIERYRSSFRRDALVFAGAAGGLIVAAVVVLMAESRILGLLKDVQA